MEKTLIALRLTYTINWTKPEVKAKAKAKVNPKAETETSAITKTGAKSLGVVFVQPPHRIIQKPGIPLCGPLFVINRR